MADRALENAEAKKKQLVDRRLQLHSEIAALDEQIGKIEAFIRDWHAFAENAFELATDETGDSATATIDSHESTPKRTTGNSRKEDVAETACMIIREQKKPVSRDELLNAVTERGMVIEGKDRAGVFTTMMWRMRDKIVKLDSGGYWLADVEYPAEGYVPPKDKNDDDAMDLI